MFTVNPIQSHVPKRQYTTEDVLYWLGESHIALIVYKHIIDDTTIMNLNAHPKGGAIIIVYPTMRIQSALNIPHNNP
jgi:hypothetical protein